MTNANRYVLLNVSKTTQPGIKNIEMKDERFHAIIVFNNKLVNRWFWNVFGWMFESLDLPVHFCDKNLSWFTFHFRQDCNKIDI